LHPIPALGVKTIRLIVRAPCSVTLESSSALRLRLACPVVLISFVVAAIASSTCADDADSPGQRQALGEATGAVPRVCTLPNCAKVLAVKHSEPEQSNRPKRIPPFGPYNPKIPPITQPTFLAQKHKDVWIIKVRKRDGTVQSIEQNYPALFEVGDWVLVEGDHVRAPD